MLKIKLSPRGKTHQISYRVVVSPDRSKLDGKFIDDIGFYTPQSKTLQIDQEKFKAWQKKGAQVTPGLDKLLNPNKYPPKPRKVKKQEEAPVKTEEVKTEEVKTEETN